MATTTNMDDWRVELDVFHGPLDLLLFLIRRDELDIFDIPIARITASYIEYLDMMRMARDAHGIDIDTIGDFLVMAATLMEIKSATLLPTPPAADGGEAAGGSDPLVDPRAELIRQLLEYKRFKDHAGVLEQQQHTHAQRFPRHPAKRPSEHGDEPPPLDLDEVQIWDLLAAFTRLMGEIGVKRRVHEVVDDDTPIDLHAADIEDRLTRDGALTLRQLLSARRSRGELVGAFLALLELIREKRIIARFSEESEEIAIEIAPEEHRKTFRGASLHLGENLGTEEGATGADESGIRADDGATGDDDAEHAAP